MDFASVRISADDLDATLVFYEKATGISVDRLARNQPATIDFAVNDVDADVPAAEVSGQRPPRTPSGHSAGSKGRNPLVLHRTYVKERSMPSSSHSSAVMITGATGGLGQSLARRLARERDFDNVMLAVRNADRGAALRDSLQTQFPDVRFAVSQMDLASLASVRAAVAQVEVPLDAIVLNAGGTGGPQPQARTPDGVSQMFAANIVGHAALVDLLLSSGLLRGTVEFVGSEAAFGVPALRLPAPAIADGSVAEFTSWIDGSWFDSRKYDRGLAHGQTKLLGALWIGALARSRPELRTVAMSPGNTSGTGVLRDLPLLVRLLIPRVNALLGRSHSLDVGTEHLAAGVLDPAYGTGCFWASAPGKMTGPVVDQAAAHPIVADHSLQDHADAALRAVFDRA